MYVGHFQITHTVCQTWNVACVFIRTSFILNLEFGFAFDVAIVKF